MRRSLQVLCPIAENTSFDYEYYFNEHMSIVGGAMSEHIQNTLVTKGIAGGPGISAGFYAIATIVFESQVASDSGMSKAGLALEDIPNFTNTKPIMLIGEVVS